MKDRMDQLEVTTKVLSTALAVGISTNIKRDPLFDNIKGLDSSKNIGAEIKAACSNLNGDWEKIEPIIKNAEGKLVQWKSNEFVVLEYDIQLNRYPLKENRAAVKIPDSPARFAVPKAKIDYAKELAKYNQAGGTLPVHTLLGKDKNPDLISQFHLDLGISYQEFTQASMKEIIVLLLWRYWSPNDYGKMEELLKSCSLLFYKMDSLVSTVNAYIMNLKKALEGRPYDKQIVSELILPNIEPSFVNWINKIRDQYQSWTSYEELFKFLYKEKEL
jgi:hypothetical protein